MTASRRLINLAGTLLVLIALVLGTILTALPIYVESLEVNGQEQTVAQSNQLLQAQISGLRTQEADLPRIEQDLAGLHSQLPTIPRLDDATQLVVKAAGAADATITSITFDSRAPFAARDAATVADQLPQTATEVTSPQPTPTANGENTNGAATPGTTPDPSESAEPLQFPVTIVVMLSDPAAAEKFLDGLRAGPRLLQIDTVTATAEDESLTLTVAGLVFVSRDS